MKSFRIALIQANYRSSFKETMPEISRLSVYKKELAKDDFDYNLNLFIKLAGKAASRGADMVLSSESIIDGWSAEYKTIKRAAVSIPGQEVDLLSETARKAEIWMCVGLFVKEESNVYNSAVIFNPEGRIHGIYRKTHETKNVLGKIPYDLGNELPVYRTAYGTVGVLICHDRWYPESVRTLKRKRADIVLNPVAAGAYSPYHKYQEIHRCVLKAQAYLNGIFLASCNCVNHGGHSLIVAPDGTIISEASAREEILVATINPDDFDSYDFVANLRPEIYD